VVTEADGSTTRTGYLNNQTAVEDPAGFVRMSTVDAAGRLTQVQENPTSGYGDRLRSSEIILRAGSSADRLALPWLRGQTHFLATTTQGEKGTGSRETIDS